MRRSQIVGTIIFCLSLLLFSLTGDIVSWASAATLSSLLGINYGRVANNLPEPAQVVSLVQSIPATKVKIYDADSEVLQAFANTGISLVVAIGNEHVASLADSSGAETWVSEKLMPYPDTLVTGIAVGNEVLTGNDAQLMANLLPAMENLQSALATYNLGDKVMVSTPHSLAILPNSYPPSGASFKSEIARTYMEPILRFLSQSGAPFMINVYPYFAYSSHPEEVSLSYALFQPNDGVTDSGSGLRYNNMFDAQVDAVYSALEGAGYADILVMVSETGWPSAGDDTENGASLENAQQYNSNLVQHLASGEGTPMRPNASVETYIFALFNENLKPGPASERNYGLFQPDKSKVYDLGLVSTSFSTTPFSFYMYSSSPLLHCFPSVILVIVVIICFLTTSSSFWPYGRTC